VVRVFCVERMAGGQLYGGREKASVVVGETSADERWKCGVLGRSAGGPGQRRSVLSGGKEVGSPFIERLLSSRGGGMAERVVW